MVRSLVLLCSALLVASGLQAQDAAQPASVPPPPVPPTVAAAPPVRVTGVVSGDRAHPQRAALGDIVNVKVQGLAALLGPGSQVHCSNLILFLNEIAILGSPPESCSPASEQVRFLLDRTDLSDHAWHVLLEEPISFSKSISVSVGLNQDLAFPSDVQNFELEVLPKAELFSYLAILVIGLLLFVRLARTTNLLRDPAVLPDGKKPPYSLARFQLAFWSLLVIAAYVFIWMVTEELDTITGSVLVLLGIGSGTALGAAVIDAGKTGPDAAAPPPPPRASRGFLNDLLSDHFGISIYRFQLFAWTLVLGVIFCASVYDGLQMPQFSTTLLGLMGLSSGTYLGFKVPESKESPPARTA
jgi:hypothetical protein